jgi:hypothetical protein
MPTRVPSTDSKFDSYIRNTTEVLETGTPTGAVRLELTTTQAAQWLSYRDQWIDIYPKYTNTATRTASVTNTKNAIKKNFSVFAETALKRIEISENLTDDDRETFNLHKRDKVPTKRGTITDIPIGKLTGAGGGILEIRVRREHDATRSSMHPLADAIEFKYLILEDNKTDSDPKEGKDDVPNADDCPLSITSKKALWRTNLGAKARGKRIIGFLRWINLSNPENNSGWSELLTTIL